MFLTQEMQAFYLAQSVSTEAETDSVPERQVTSLDVLRIKGERGHCLSSLC